MPNQPAPILVGLILAATLLGSWSCHEPLPFNEPDDLVVLWEIDGDGVSVGVDRATFLAWRAASVGLASVSAHRMTELEGENVRRVRAALVTAEMFETLGAAPRLGRTFLREEESQASAVIVLSAEFWQEHFAGRPDTVGRPIELGGRAYTILGIMPPGFRYPSDTVDAWTPLDLEATDGDHDLTVTARLSSGITARQSEESLRSVSLSCGHEGRVLTLRDALAGR